MRKIYAALMLCIGLACGWAADTFCEQRPFTGRYTAAPAGIKDESMFGNYGMIWLDAEQGWFWLSFSGMLSMRPLGQYWIENNQLICRSGPPEYYSYYYFEVENANRLRYLGAEQPKGTPVGPESSAHLLDGKVLRYLDGQTISEAMGDEEDELYQYMKAIGLAKG